LGGFLVPVAIIAVWLMSSWVRILKEYERGVKFRLGRLVRKPMGPGIVFVIFPPIFETLVKVDMRTVTLDVPPQDVISRDNISVKVSAVLYYRVVDPLKAVVEIEDFAYATSQIAQTTLRSLIGHFTLDEMLSNRDTISEKVQSLVDQQTEPWGVKILNVEIKHVEIPHEMQRAIAREAEAERERRAKIISAQGEFQAAERLVDAARMMEKHPMSMQMRYLQTLVELGTENSTTVVFPMPIDILSPFIDAFKNRATHDNSPPEAKPASVDLPLAVSSLPSAEKE
jgi:regulator of protease activity HflC (stomatin/prohibitin superfamily)